MRTEGSEEKSSSNIVIIDDEVDFLNHLSDTLEAAGFNVNTFTSGVDALSSRACTNVDVLVADIILPGNLDGWQAIEQVKKQCPKVDSLAITAFYEPEYKEKAKELGVYACVEKPISVSLLSDIIGSCLVNQRLKAELLGIRSLQENEDLRNSELVMLQAAFDVMPFPVLIVHKNGKLLFSNKIGKGFLREYSGAGQYHNNSQVPSEVMASVDRALNEILETHSEESFSRESLEMKMGAYKIRTWALKSSFSERVAVVFIEPEMFSSESFFESESAKVWIPIIMKLKS